MSMNVSWADTFYHSYWSFQVWFIISENEETAKEN